MKFSYRDVRKDEKMYAMLSRGMWCIRTSVLLLYSIQDSRAMTQWEIKKGEYTAKLFSGYNDSLAIIMYG